MPELVTITTFHLQSLMLLLCPFCHSTALVHIHFHLIYIYILRICQTLLSKALFVAFKAHTLSVAFSGKRTHDLSIALLFELQDSKYFYFWHFQKGYEIRPERLKNKSY